MFVLDDGVKNEIVIKYRFSSQKGTDFVICTIYLELCYDSVFLSKRYGGGKSLYINHLRNLILSISTFTAIAVMFFANSENVYSQCPPGFNGIYTTTMHIGPGCKVEIDYCLSPSPSSGLCNIHITRQRIIGEMCAGYLPVDQNGNYGVSMGDIVTHITRLPENYSCFNMINLSPCDEQLSRPTILVSNGGCYYFVEGLTLEGEYIREYIPCDMSGINYCYEYFSFCKEFVDGAWRIKAIAGPPVEQFECLDANCSSYCF